MIKFDIRVFFFENLLRKFKCNKNRTRITGNLREELFTFVTVSRSVLLRMKNVSDKICRENQNAHFMFNNFFPDNRPFMR